MKYDFDQEIDRSGTNSVKWEFIQREDDPTRIVHTDRFFGDDRLLPLWVADMDFRCPQPVVDAIVARAQHGLFGYTMPTDSYFEAVAGWMKKRHDWTIDTAWITTTPGVVPALNLLLRTFINPGDKVLILTPVYYPFYKAIENQGGQVCGCPLLYQDGRYTMDFEAIEAAAGDPQVKATLLSSPHNPVGRVWTRDELTRLGEICLANDVLVISDEIHGDLIMRGQTFTPFATLGDDFARRSITCTAPSKTFNLAGLSTSNIIIPDPDLHAAYRKTMGTTALHGASLFGIPALEAAYREGEDWLEQVLDYLQGNLDTLGEFLARHLPQISLVPLEGTYLAWLDCRALGLDGKALRNLMVNEARVYLDEGVLFGPEGEGFERINLACPRPLLVDALERIKGAVERQGSATSG